MCETGTRETVTDGTQVEIDVANSLLDCISYVTLSALLYNIE